MPMRTRVIRPGFFTNYELCSLPCAARILFEGLWCMADREGRLEDRPEQIKIEVLPYDEVEVDRLLWMLYAKDFIIRYEAAGRQWIQIINFAKHQTIHRDEKRSVAPMVSTGIRRVPHGSAMLCSSLFSSATSHPLAGQPASDAPVNPYSPPPNGTNGKSEASPTSTPAGAINVAEWPATAQAIRSSITAWTGDQKIAEIIAEALEARPKLTDAQLAEVVPRARTVTQKTAGLFKKTIPELLRSGANARPWADSGNFRACKICHGALRLSGDRIASSREARWAEEEGWRICCCDEPVPAELQARAARA